MLDPASLERRSLGNGDGLAAAAPPARPASRQLSDFQLAIATMVAIAVLAVLVAALRLSDASIQRSVEQREAPDRFLAQELSVLRLMAMSSPSVVPARLYLGIEECFRARAPLPFDDSRAAEARAVLAACAELEIGRLQAQAGAAMADEGRRVLSATLSGFSPR